MATRNRQRRPRASPPPSEAACAPAALRDLANVGLATLRDFETLGIRTVAQLAKQEPFALYRKLCRVTGARHDPCVMDVMIATIAEAQGRGARPWWHYTPQRKARLAAEPSLAEVKLRSRSR